RATPPGRRSGGRCRVHGALTALKAASLTLARRPALPDRDRTALAFPSGHVARPLALRLVLGPWLATDGKVVAPPPLQARLDALAPALGLLLCDPGEEAGQQLLHLGRAV